MKNLKITNLMKNDRSIANQFMLYYVENGKKYKINGVIKYGYSKFL